MGEDTNYKGEALDPLAHSVLWEKRTETPFSGAYVHTKDKGTYVCMSCGNPLFSSDVKFDSKTGWPSFSDAIPGSVSFHEDSAYGMQRTEVVCAKCNAHLGHVFEDGPDMLESGEAGTGKRYCINSVCLDLQKDS